MNRVLVSSPLATRNSQLSGGFTLLEVLLAMALMGWLSLILAGLWKNMNLALGGGRTAAESLREAALVRELIQDDLFRAATAVSYVSNKSQLGSSGSEVVRGVEFEGYGSLAGLDLRLRIGYAFKPQEEGARVDGKQLFKLVRTSVPAGIGTQETEETLLGDLTDVRITLSAQDSDEFLESGLMTGEPASLRMEWTRREQPRSVMLRLPDQQKREAL